MITTIEQKKWLQDYLYQTMRYRETYEEVYDHILLALENHPEQQFFETTVMDIISSDFGDTNGLYDLEEKCSTAAMINVEAQYRVDIKKWFSTPLIFLTASLFGIIYCFTFKLGLTLALFFIFLLILPVFIWGYRRLRIAYNYRDTKASLKDKIFSRITFKANYILWMTGAVLDLVNNIRRYLFNYTPQINHHNTTSMIGRCIWSTVLTLMIVHILSIIKLHRNEFKTGIIAK